MESLLYPLAAIPRSIRIGIVIIALASLSLLDVTFLSQTIGALIYGTILFAIEVIVFASIYRRISSQTVAAS